MRNAAIYQFEVAISRYIIDSGLLTDELMSPRVNTSPGIAPVVANAIDERITLQGSPNPAVNTGRTSYQNLQDFRAFANQAIGALAAYDTVAADSVSSRVSRGELYALEGYVEVLLSDFFCSGVPLSTLDFAQDYTLHGGSTTAEVYHDAIAKFDTALTLAVGNDSITNLARIGRGRAWLNLGQFDSAFAAVQYVPNDFSVAYSGVWHGCEVSCLLSEATVSSREGINGLPYQSSRDPRSTVISVSYAGSIHQFPQKYQTALSGSTSSLITVASGVEAQLIRAEVALHTGDINAWVSILNTLRTSGTVDSLTWIDTVGISPGVYGDSGRLVDQYIDTVYNNAHTSITRVDTINTYQRPIWRAGFGGIAGLYPISDPGTAAARIDTMFTERAMWFFLTGHRQSDLRRLLRQYGDYPEFNDQSKVYPTGLYQASGVGVYGSDVTVVIPVDENTNPLFHGCLNRDA
jgi:hypothetical protein